MATHTDTIIIGGGISGLLTARELLLANRQVTVIDRAGIGRESSWAGGGILLPLYPWRQPAAVSELAMRSVISYPALQAELLEATGIDPEWRPCGMLICKNPDAGAAAQWLAHYRVAAQTPPAAVMAGLAADFDQPLWLPEVAQIRNPRLLQSLRAYLERLGCRFREHAGIHRLDVQNGAVTGLDTTAGQFSCAELIVCAGAWTAGLLHDWLPAALPIRPVKGQMLVFDAQPDTLTQMVLDGDKYLIPRRDGRILAGSTVESTDFDKSTTAAARAELSAFATGLLPALQHFPVSHHWAGLRPGTPQGIPYIGRHPAYRNLSINAGHFRNGLVMGPASARLLADLLLNRQPAIDPAPYFPGRLL